MSSSVCCNIAPGTNPERRRKASSQAQTEMLISVTSDLFESISISFVEHDLATFINVLSGIKKPRVTDPMKSRIVRHACLIIAVAIAVAVGMSFAMSFPEEPS